MGMRPSKDKGLRDLKTQSPIIKKEVLSLSLDLIFKASRAHKEGILC